MNDKEIGNRLLTERDFRALLGGVCVRKFKQMRADGIVCAPLDLGARTLRWRFSDYEEVVARLPRRQERRPEPEMLARGRKQRRERLAREQQFGAQARSD